MDTFLSQYLLRTKGLVVTGMQVYSTLADKTIDYDFSKVNTDLPDIPDSQSTEEELTAKESAQIDLLIEASSRYFISLRVMKELLTITGRCGSFQVSFRKFLKRRQEILSSYDIKPIAGDVESGYQQSLRSIIDLILSDAAAKGDINKHLVKGKLGIRISGDGTPVRIKYIIITAR